MKRHWKLVENTPIPLVGKTVARAFQGSGEEHSLDGGFTDDGAVVIEFVDGTRLVIEGRWCNDGTASTGWDITETQGTQPPGPQPVASGSAA